MENFGAGGSVTGVESVWFYNKFFFFAWWERHKKGADIIDMEDVFISYWFLNLILVCKFHVLMDVLGLSFASVRFVLGGHWNMTCKSNMLLKVSLTLPTSPGFGEIRQIKKL